MNALDYRSFSAATQVDAIRVINTYLTDWPYTRPVDQHLVDRWRGLPRFQPDWMGIVYRDGHPRAFIHGESVESALHIHLLALMPDAVSEGVWLLDRMEHLARQAGLQRMIGPHYTATAFYGAYILGNEPYHPHWAIEGTEAWVRAGFRISHPAVLMVRSLKGPVDVGTAPAGYTIAARPERTEFDAQPFGYQALYHGETVAYCDARLFPGLLDPTGRPVGQLGHVATDQAHRGKGLATMMSRLCLERLRNMGAGTCLVATGLDNDAALRAYEKTGFERHYNINEWSKKLT